MIINSFCNDIHQQLHLLALNVDRGQMKKTYDKFFHNIEYINNLAKSSLASKLTDETMLKDKQVEKFKKIKEYLEDRKEYYQNCVEVFKHEHKSLDISLSSAFNKLQNHNSRLIAECNGLKEQLQKKSKTLNELFTTLRTIDCMNIDLIRDPYHTH